jgi:hypothetical protein
LVLMLLSTAPMPQISRASRMILSSMAVWRA